MSGLISTGELIRSASTTEPCGALETFEALEGLRGEWDALRARVARPTPNTDYERFVAITRAMGGSVRPWVMAVRGEDARVRAMVVGRVSKRRVPCSLGYVIVKTPS